MLAIVIAVMIPKLSGSVASSWFTKGAMYLVQALELVHSNNVPCCWINISVIWLGDQITVKGFGNGTSILIFVNIYLNHDHLRVS